MGGAWNSYPAFRLEEELSTVANAPVSQERVQASGTSHPFSSNGNMKSPTSLGYEVEKVGGLPL